MRCDLLVAQKLSGKLNLSGTIIRNIIIKKLKWQELFFCHNSIKTYFPDVKQQQIYLKKKNCNIYSCAFKIKCMLPPQVQLMVSWHTVSWHTLMFVYMSTCLCRLCFHEHCQPDTMKYPVWDKGVNSNSTGWPLSCRVIHLWLQAMVNGCRPCSMFSIGSIQHLSTQGCILI